MNKIPRPNKIKIIYRSNTKGHVILCNIRASDRQRKDFQLKLAEPGSGWQIELTVPNLPNKAKYQR